MKVLNKEQLELLNDMEYGVRYANPIYDHRVDELIDYHYIERITKNYIVLTDKGQHYKNWIHQFKCGDVGEMIDAHLSQKSERFGLSYLLIGRKVLVVGDDYHAETGIIHDVTDDARPILVNLDNHGVVEFSISELELFY